MEEEELTEVHNNLTFNYLVDQKKRKVDNRARAKLIREYTRKKKISVRTLAYELEMPKSTLQDWLLWEKLSEEDYDTLKKRLKTDTAIYRLLRNNRNKFASSLIKQTTILTDIEQIKKLVTHLLSNPPKNKTLITDLKDIQNTINRIIMRMERY